MSKPLRERVDHVLNVPDVLAGRFIELSIGVLILTVSTLFVLQTMPALEPYSRLFERIEDAITLLFIVEYLTRWWAKGFSLRYLVTPLALVDLTSILPFFLPQTHFQFVRVLRLFRILRMLRLVQSRKFFFGQVTESHLIVLRILFTIFCLVFITGGLVYEFEHPVNPRFKSLFDGLYFAVVSLTTVGFGDLAPVSLEGRAVSMVMILTGVMVVPWQLTNLARIVVQEASKKHITCEHCGLTYHDADASHCKACGNVIYQEYPG